MEHHDHVPQTEGRHKFRPSTMAPAFVPPTLGNSGPERHVPAALPGGQRCLYFANAPVFTQHSLTPILEDAVSTSVCCQGLTF